MTVPVNPAKAGPFAGNGVTTVFAFSFKTTAATEIQVIKTSTAGADSTLVLNSGYTVSLNVDQVASPGGTITVTPAPASGEKITILGAVPYSQGLDLTNGGAFSADAIEAALDRTVQQVKQLKEITDRAVTVSPSSSSTPSQLIGDLNAAVASAQAQATAASNSASAAAGSASAASGSASAASGSASAASGSASAASGSASTASGHASTATTKASEAAASAAAAAASAASIGPAPPGAIAFLAAPSIPAGWLHCNGQAVSRTTYANLFAAIGELYGVGNGTTTFNVPDLRDKFVIGASAGKSQGSTGGAETVTLGANNLPPHQHGYKLGGVSSGGGASNNLGGTLGTTYQTDDGGFANDPVNILNPYMALTPIIKT